MKRLLVLLAFIAASVFAPSLVQAQPVAKGKVVVVGKVDGGTLPVPVVGGVLYDTITQSLLISDGGTWAPVCQ